MPRVEACALPEHALLRRYCNKTPGKEGAYTDCFRVDAGMTASLAEYVHAFYTTPVFRVERFVLRILAARPSSDSDSAAVADGTADAFAAWTVEQRTTNQLLMCDMRGHTRSWFMVTSGATGTTLWFGSAVVPKTNTDTGKRQRSRGFKLLIGLHKRYSTILLAAARSRLARVRHLHDSLP